MTNSKVAKRYALALLELATEQGQLETWGQELEKLARVVGDPQLLAQLISPELADEQRLEAVTVIATRMELSYPLRSFALVVARHGRIADMPAIAQAYQTLLDSRLGRARASITFATQPTGSELARVVEGLEKISGKKVLATVNVDPGLIGGVVAELEGRTYDSSLATRLEVLERQLSR